MSSPEEQDVKLVEPANRVGDSDDGEDLSDLNIIMDSASETIHKQKLTIDEQAERIHDLERRAGFIQPHVERFNTQIRQFAQDIIRLNLHLRYSVLFHLKIAVDDPVWDQTKPNTLEYAKDVPNFPGSVKKYCDTLEQHEELILFLISNRVLVKNANEYGSRAVSAHLMMHLRLLHLFRTTDLTSRSEVQRLQIAVESLIPETDRIRSGDNQEFLRNLSRNLISTFTI